MKTSIKLAVALFAGVLLLFILGGFYLWSIMPKLTQDRLELPPNVVGINTGFAYSWLIPTETGILLIDAGHDDQGIAIKAELAQQGYSINDVHTILLTHGHTDHWGGTAAFPKAEIYIHEADLSLFNRSEPEVQNPAINFFQTQMTKDLIAPTAYQIIQGDQILEIDGEQFKVFSIPGHTPGSIAILWNDILFLGDSALNGKAGLDHPPDMFGGNHEQTKISLKPLLNEDFSIIALAHSTFIENGHEALEIFINSK